MHLPTMGSQALRMASVATFVSDCADHQRALVQWLMCHSAGGCRVADSATYHVRCQRRCNPSTQAAQYL